MLELIRTAGVFMIIAQTMYHFVSGSRYARYVRLLIRIMTLAVLIVPLLDLIKSGAKEDFDARLLRFEQEYEEILQGAGHAGETYVDERIVQEMTEEIRAAVDPVLAPYGYETAFVSADENGLLFMLRRLNTDRGEILVRPVREINVTIGESAEQADEGLADVIADHLQVERSWVEVRIIE